MSLFGTMSLQSSIVFALEKQRFVYGEQAENEWRNDKFEGSAIRQ